MTAHLCDEDEVSLSDASGRRVLAGRRQSGVAQLRIPVGPAPLGREVEEIPLWVDGIDVARVLPRFGRGVEELGAPEVADHFTVAPEHVEHRHLGSLRALAKVVAVVGVSGRGQQPQPPPAALLRMDQDARQRGLGDNHEIDALRDVLRGSVQGIKHGSAMRARLLVVERAREHEVVDHERVLAGHEQLRQPHLGRGAAGSCLLEDVVLRDDPDRRIVCVWLTEAGRQSQTELAPALARWEDALRQGLVPYHTPDEIAAFRRVLATLSYTLPEGDDLWEQLSASWDTRLDLLRSLTETNE